MLVVTTMARLCAQMAFASARDLSRHLFEWAPSSRAVLRMVDAVGERARGFLEQAPHPKGTGRCSSSRSTARGRPQSRARNTRGGLVRTASEAEPGTTPGRQKRAEQPRKRRGPGKKSKNAKMAAIGVLYTLKRDAEGKLDGPVKQTRLRDLRRLPRRVRVDGPGGEETGVRDVKITKVLFVADGANAIWALQQEFFPDAEVCLDWYHVVEEALEGRQGNLSRDAA